MARKPFLRRKAAHAQEERTDAELMSCFLTAHDDSAFAAFVKRYGRMMWNVCLQVLHHRQDAEAAQQQTFIILIRKAEFIRASDGEPLANWLRETAYREARNIQKKRRRREAHERACNEAQLAQRSDEVDFSDLQNQLYAELERLPEKYCVPFMLHCLEGKCKREVARELGLPEGTVARRVRKARELLRQKL